jgi:5-oxoprolinase (ATP-hydrolysing)
MKPGEYPGCSGSRNLGDNISDLKAQIAANQKGIELINSLIDEYSLDVVQAYMIHIQNTAEESVRILMKQVCLENPTNELACRLYANEFMDDGSNIELKVTIEKNTGSAVFDFSGTSYQVIGNLNAPRAITFSAIIYCLRCMINYSIPLNQGCLKPIEVVINKGSILWPSDDAAVVGGNVLTSQRIVDVIFKAFRVCAASQGCMNNITFGNERVGYYETVGERIIKKTLFWNRK